MGYLFKPNPAIGAVLGGGSGVRAFTKLKAEAIAVAAKEVFESQVKHEHNRRGQQTEPRAPTPPAYADSFFVRPNFPMLGFVVGNSDPASIWVEWGAHPRGGSTLVLKYKPLTRGVDIVSSRGP